jgi:hypothetical protein
MEECNMWTNVFVIYDTATGLYMRNDGKWVDNLAKACMFTDYETLSFEYNFYRNRPFIAREYNVNYDTVVFRKVNISEGDYFSGLNAVKEAFKDER